MASTNTSGNLEAALAGIPEIFRERLINTYKELKAAFFRGDPEKASLKTGKLCETLVRFLQQEILGGYTQFGTKLPNITDECLKIEKSPKSGAPEGLRIIIPRAINFLVTIRNKRDIGHAGGDIDANEIDAATCVRVADWCLCELIRIYHKLPLEEAQQILDNITERQMPQVWSVMGKKRVLQPGLSYGEQTVLLMYSDPELAVLSEDLFEWTGHSNLSVYKRDVLRVLHRKRLIEYDEESEMAVISPLGIKIVEDEILSKGALKGV